LISATAILAIGIATWLLVVNVAAFAALHRQAAGHRRSVAHIGRDAAHPRADRRQPGAVAGQRYFRHKTQKQPFRSSLQVIILLQIVGVALLALNPHRVTDFFQQFSAALAR
jgi:uncharacterized membrane protein YsdA (DUF1294 family)